jgi:predicted Zn-dependent protease
MALSGLQEAPHNQQLLALASESYQALERWDQSLELANQLIEFHPSLHMGYLKAAQNLLKLNKPNEASSIAERGLKAKPNHPHLHSIASEAYRARHLHNRSLNHAKALIETQPDSIEGHKRAAQDLTETRAKE